VTDPQRVTIHISGGVADVRLNRPEKLNALDIAMFEAIVAAGERLAGERGVRAVVLSGEGRAFCAGLDFEAFAAMAGAAQANGGVPDRGDTDRGDTDRGDTDRGDTDRGDTDRGDTDRGDTDRGDTGAGERASGVRALGERPPGRPANLGQQAAYTWTELPVPVIAAVHGVALGGGLQIALGADLRVVAPDAKLSVLEIRWGLVPDMTGTQVLPRLVPLDVAKELTWTGRMVSGEEAVAMGLATRVAADPRAAALELAADIAGRSPHAVRAAKRLLNQSGQVDLSRQLLDESKEIGALIGSPNQAEAVRAWFEKREPVFTDP
jgi:enoyl-CoA hydratase/carnithine racemase